MNMRKFNLLLIIVLISSCSNQKKSALNSPQDVNLKYKEYTPIGSEIVISRADYLKLMNNISISKKRKLEIIDLIKKIAQEHGYDEAW